MTSPTFVSLGQAKRFEKPKYAKPWAGVLNGTYFREACAQPELEESSFGGISQTESMSEDCLYLNVWRPRTNFVTDIMLGGMVIPMRRVMVYFVGNGYEKGTIFSQLSDARYMASLGDVVVVTVQSRLGMSRVEMIPFEIDHTYSKDHLVTCMEAPRMRLAMLDYMTRFLHLDGSFTT